MSLCTPENLRKKLESFGDSSHTRHAQSTQREARAISIFPIWGRLTLDRRKNSSALDCTRLEVTPTFRRRMDVFDIRPN